jgi:cytoskeletal protein RodZ
MKTIGETLKRVREKQQLTIEEVSARTFIRPEFLTAIENNEFRLLPSSAAVQGFISTYAGLLGIEKHTALAILRRDFEVTAKEVLPKQLSSPSPRRRVLSHTMRIALLMFLGVMVISGYGLWSFWRLRQPPQLQVISPRDGMAVSKTVLVRGRTATDATVEVDSLPVALNQDGEFTQELTLTTGDHIITVIARSRKKQETIKQLTVHVQ